MREDENGRGFDPGQRQKTPQQHHVFINEGRKLLNFSIKISLCVLHVGQTYCETIYLRREQKGAG